MSFWFPSFHKSLCDPRRCDLGSRRGGPVALLLFLLAWILVDTAETKSDDVDDVIIVILYHGPRPMGKIKVFRLKPGFLLCNL